MLPDLHPSSLFTPPVTDVFQIIGIVACHKVSNLECGRNNSEIHDMSYVCRSPLLTGMVVYGSLGCMTHSIRVPPS